MMGLSLVVRKDKDSSDWILTVQGSEKEIRGVLALLMATYIDGREVDDGRGEILSHEDD
jgi:hypothetical protein